LNTTQPVIVTIVGPDQPGITSTCMGVLAKHPVRLADLGQTVVYGSLTLVLLLEHATDAVFADLRRAAETFRMRVDFKPVENPLHTPPPEPGRYAVTLLKKPLGSGPIHWVLDHLARFDLNIDRIQKLSAGEMECVEFLVSSKHRALAGADATALRADLLKLATHLEMDIAFQADGMFRRAKRLVVFDMDSTLIGQEVIDEFARERGVYDAVSEITHRAMQGSLNFETSLHERVALLRGLTLEHVERVYQRLTLSPGADDLMRWLRKLGMKTAIVSGGFSLIAEKLRQRLGMDAAYANTLEFVDGVCTGKVIPPIVHSERKADLLVSMAFQERISLDQVVAVGDGANDLLMLQKAGLGIAYNAKAIVNERAAVAMRKRPLTHVAYLMGHHERDFQLS
jgi:phosphoserine phosphatase